MSATAETTAPQDPKKVLYPIVVDLDGTLLKTDSLVEQFVAALSKRPLTALAALRHLVHGRAAFKDAVASMRTVELETLPRRHALIEYLASEHAGGTELHLVSAANDDVVTRIGDSVGLFRSRRGSDRTLNLKGGSKLAYLERAFPAGFVYAGDSRADLSVWRGAKGIILAGARPATARRARSLGVPVVGEFETGHVPASAIVRAMRPHQWSKNLLLFVPLALGTNLGSVSAAVACTAGFAIMCLLASSTYILNDVVDLSSDRKHPRKRHRPLASGELPLAPALVAAAAALPILLLLAASLSTAFFLAVSSYLTLTIAYTTFLKRIPVVDALALAALYTLRLMMGTLLAGVDPSEWLLVFAAFLFVSLTLAKRYVEIATLARRSGETLAGRGYVQADLPLVLALGVATAVASVFVIIEYLMVDAFPSEVYANPVFLWTVPAVLSLWTGRVWLLAVRGRLHDDPVAFAVRDPSSLILGGGMVAAFAAARFLPLP